VYAGGAAQGRGEDAERGAGGGWIAPPDEHLDRLAAAREIAEELGAEPRLADAGGAEDEHGAGDGLRRALAEEAEQHVDLALAADARDLAAEEPPTRGRLLALADELEPRGPAAHVEAEVEQPRGGLIDTDGARPAAGALAR
jgi:hypothetical protein